jgi:hypothetical protein
MTLEDRIRDILARLSVLTEAPSAGTLAAVAPPASLPKEQRVESDRKAKTPKRHHESAIPAGVDLHDRDPDRAPPKDRSLFDHYAWHFARIDADAEPIRATMTLLLAERDYTAVVFPDHHREALRSGALLGDNAEGKVAEEVAVRRIVEEYKGVPALEVAIFEYTTEEWVRKARKLMGCEPDNGHPRPPFLDWDDETREREVRKLYNRGLGQKKAAARLEVAKSTIQRYWPEPAAAAA